MNNYIDIDIDNNDLTIQPISLFKQSIILDEEINNYVCKKFNSIDSYIDFVSGKLKDGTIQQHINTIVNEIIENPIENLFLAGKLEMLQIYMLAGENINIRNYVKTFFKILEPSTSSFLVLYEKELSQMLNFLKDFECDYFAACAWKNTYLTKPKSNSSIKEVPQMCLLRISTGLSEGNFELCSRFYNALSNQYIVPATPTIFYAGTNRGSPISCVIDTMADDLEDIFEVIKQNSLSTAKGSGIGLDVSSLRRSDIANQGRAESTTKLLKAIDNILEYTTQGGRRKGTTSPSICDWHLDLQDIVKMAKKDNPDSFQNLKISIQLSELFMERVRKNEMWTFFCPKQASGLSELNGDLFEEKYIEYEKLARENPGLFYTSTVPARELLELICHVQITSGQPFLIYTDRVNACNPQMNRGKIRGMNLCQEIGLPAIPKKETAACILSSISLKKMVDKTTKTFNFKLFKETVELSVIFLNKTIDLSLRIDVSKKIKTSLANSRPIGIGVSGFADMLWELDLPLLIPNTDDKIKIDRYSLNKDFISLYPNNSFNEKYLSEGLIEKYPEFYLLNKQYLKLNPQVKLLNKQIWSSMYYHALNQSCELSKNSGIGYIKAFPGSPISQGKFQFDLAVQDDERRKNKYGYVNEFTLINPPSVNSQSFNSQSVNENNNENEYSWDTLRKKIIHWGVYNMNLLSVQPTATSAQIVSSTENVEFPISHIYRRKVISGEFTVITNPLLKKLKQEGLWSAETYSDIVKSDGSILKLDYIDFYTRNKFRTAWEIPQMAIVELAADRQYYIDHSQSMSLFLLENLNPAYLSKIHQEIYKKGIKTGMYYLHTRNYIPMIDLGLTKKKKTIVNNNNNNNNINNETNNDEQTKACPLRPAGFKGNDDECLMCSS